MKNIIAEITARRVWLDTLSDSLGRQYESAPLNRFQQSVILAKAWLGKALGELDVASPYKNDGKRTTAAMIEDTSDQATDLTKEYLESNVIIDHQSRVTRIDSIRQEVGKQVAELKDILPPHITAFVHENVIRHLSEARFHLGFELGRIHEIVNS